VRLEHLTSDLAPLQHHLGFHIDVGNVNASAREQNYRAYYTNDYAIMWRGYVQMTSRDLSMPFKGFYVTRTPNFCVPSGGTAGQCLPAPLAGGFTL
jgi:hypothetical protein